MVNFTQHCRQGSERSGAPGAHEKVTRFVPTPATWALKCLCAVCLGGPGSLLWITCWEHNAKKEAAVLSGRCAQTSCPGGIWYPGGVWQS